MSDAMDKHHRKPRSVGGDTNTINGHHNISYVQQKQHRAWHTLFRNYEPQEICAIINEIWLSPDYKFICVPREKGTWKKHKKKKLCVNVKPSIEGEFQP